MGEFSNFRTGSDSRLGLTRVVLNAGAQAALFGTGAFMIMNPPPGTTMHPLQSAVHAGASALADTDLDARERAILDRADETLRTQHGARGFLRRFWGFNPAATADGATCVTCNGPHLGNRVGYLQGGLQMGLALETAAAALSDEWAVSGIASSFLSQGQGAQFTAEARIEHRGRNTAAIRTVITGETGRRVLVTDTTHQRRREAGSR